VPLYEITKGELAPFKRLQGGAELYESQIEDLLWGNPDEFLGEPLFRVARQPTVSGGGKPDIVALDEAGRVVVIEVKRHVDRGQLAQCLEYAGWARGASLDELAGMYHAGPSNFFSEWQTFTDSLTPTVIKRSPRLVLVAHDFHGRTEQALQFLMDNHLPVRLVRVSIYEDAQSRRFVDVEGEFEPAFPTSSEEVTPVYSVDGQRVRLGDLLEAGFLQAGDALTWDRPRLGQSYTATLKENGAIELSNGESYASPSKAATVAAGLQSYDGWLAWKVERLDGALLKTVRQQFVEQAKAKE